jgi:hypothetical protein
MVRSLTAFCSSQSSRAIEPARALRLAYQRKAA